MSVPVSRIRRGGVRGQALVELALILPVILILLVGMLEFARAWNVHQALTDATREGARRAVVKDPNMDQDSVKAAVWRGLAQAGYDPAKAGPGYQVNIIGNWRETGENIIVDVQLPYRFWVLSGFTINMRSTFTMRNE